MRTLFALCFCLLTTITHAQSHLENPTTGSNQSGLGIISGWVCNANTIEIVVDGSIRVQAPYGTLRGDTRAACGDVNNGFAFGVNWNELGDGTHTLVVLADGNQFGQATFTVKTLGVPFLTGASGSYQLQGFAGKNITVQWAEPLQNFVITGWSPIDGGTTSLAELLGRWAFTYTIVSTYTDHYLLPSVTTTPSGTPIIVGTDLDSGGQIAAARIQDLITTSLPYQFALLDPDIGICDFFIFNKTGANTVSGQYYLAIKNASGDCGTLVSSTPHSMTGLRTSSAVTAQGAPASSLLLDTQKQYEAQTSVLSAQDYPTQEEPAIDSAVLIEILQNMQQ